MRDKVTPEIRSAVMLRDLTAMTRVGIWGAVPICIAPIVDAAEYGKCWGRSRMEHVHGQNEHGIGKPRATSDMAHQVTLCQGHTEDGAKAGFVWCTNADNRQLCRDYLAAQGETE